MTFDRAAAVADAILYEGYALYPYRPSAVKNVERWQFGIVAPRAAAEDNGADPWWVEAQCLVEGQPSQVEGRLRFLRARPRQLGVGTSTWDEGEPCEIDFCAKSREEVIPFEVIGGATEAEGRALLGAIRVRVEDVVAERPLSRLTVRVENRTPVVGRTVSRADALRSSFLGAHFMLGVSGAGFLSLIDPPPWAEGAAEACKNVRVFPVLVGARGARDAMLASPIILYDYPEVAPESPQDLFDATEIDEILVLRTRLLTDDEKREARDADPRIRRLIDRADALGEAELSRLHGTFRAVGGVGYAPGDRVRLRPGMRRTDAQDMFLDGRTATVQAVMQDIDGHGCVAVTIDDDPAAELHAWHGRFHYFREDEVEPAVTSS